MFDDDRKSADVRRSESSRKLIDKIKEVLQKVHYSYNSCLVDCC